MQFKPMKTIRFGTESQTTYEVTDSEARDIIQSLEEKLTLKLDKSIIKTSDPTTDTVGMVGQICINKLTESVFLCVKVVKETNTYVWKNISDFDDYYTKEEIDDRLSGVYSFMGSVNSVNDLPTEHLTHGDVYNVLDTGMNYAWNGHGWVQIGSNINFSNYYTKEDVNMLVSNIETTPEQYNNAGKALTTDGENSSWNYLINMNNLSNSTNEGLPKLVINKLTQAEYDELVENDMINENELYTITDAVIPTKTSELENDSNYMTSDTTYSKDEVDELLTSVSTASFIYEQKEDASEWIIEHNLNKYPYVVIVDSDGEEFVGKKVYIDNNTIKMVFSMPVSGKAFLN